METLNSFFVCQKSYISQSLSLDLASPLQNCVVLILDIFCHSGEQTEWAQFQPDMTKCVLVEDDPVTRDKGGSGEPVPSDVPLTVEPEKKQQGRSVRTMMMMMTCTAVPAYSRAQPKNQSKPEFLWFICPPPGQRLPWERSHKDINDNGDDAKMTAETWGPDFVNANLSTQVEFAVLLQVRQRFLCKFIHSHLTDSKTFEKMIQNSVIEQQQWRRHKAALLARLKTGILSTKHQFLCPLNT